MPLLVLLVLLALLRAPPAAAADRRPRAQLNLDPCAGVDGAEVERIFTIELGARLSTDAPAADTSQLYVTCGENGAELRVDDPLTGKSLFRVIDVAAAPLSARPRLLALALAELLFTSWTELEISLQPDPPEGPRVVLPDGQPLPPAPARSAAGLLVRQRLPPRPASSELRLLGLFASQGFRTTGPLLGGGLRVGGDYAHHLGFDADFLSHHGQTSTSLGDVAVDTLCAGAALLAQGRVLRATLRGGVGLRGGAARLSGTPQDPQKGLGATLWGALLRTHGLPGRRRAAAGPPGRRARPGGRLRDLAGGRPRRRAAGGGGGGALAGGAARRGAAAMKRALPLLALLSFCRCTGIEGDVLTRTPADLSIPAIADAAVPFACKTLVVSGACQPEAQWKDAANMACLGQGQELASYSGVASCDMGYTSAQALCCPQEVLLGCIQETLGGPMSGMCQDAMGWTASADSTCSAAGFYLWGLSTEDPGGPGQACGAGLFGGATYLCCPKPSM